MTSLPPPKPTHLARSPGVSRTIAGALLLWTVGIAGALAWNLAEERAEAGRHARIEAETIINKDLALRRWVASRGGVYVRPGAETPPNPFLAGPGRDVVTSDGQALTLMNPAYVLRQVMETYGHQSGGRGHITSLVPRNPDNAPDPWERQALVAFSRGASEAVAVGDVEGRPAIRLMLPMRMEEACLKCHADTGVEVGEVRGGISTVVPLERYLASSRQHMEALVLSHGGLWLAGFAGMGLAWRRARREEGRRQVAEAALLEQQALLEATVAERTAQWREELAQREQAQQGLETANAELARACADLKQSQSLLVQNEKMAAVGVLAAGIAHEINNPNSFVMSNLQILHKYAGRVQEFLAAGADPERQAELPALRARLKIDAILADLESLVAESLEGTQRIKNIVLNMKQFARREDGDSRLADVNAGLASTLNIVWHELKYKATVQKELGPLPFTRCNLGQLNQVFLNLIMNAVQAIPEQGEITIRSWHDGDQILVAVSDNGHGMAPEIQARIFEPFFTTKEPGKGTGLGLAISYDIVRQHGGEITVASEPGSGTTFTVRLPVQA
ncbi:MAG: ATP-binding protein [Thermodesulfobacteriota bacterium]